MERNGKLKAAIFEATQREVAQQAGLHESQVSLVLSGRLNLSTEEKRRIADVLRRPIPELFPGD